MSIKKIDRVNVPSYSSPLDASSRTPLFDASLTTHSVYSYIEGTLRKLDRLPPNGATNHNRAEDRGSLMFLLGMLEEGGLCESTFDECKREDPALYSSMCAELPKIIKTYKL